MDGKGARPNFSNLQETIKDMTERVQEHIKGEAAPIPASTSPQPQSGTSAPVASLPHRNGNGSVQSIDEVVQMLGEICKYYEVNDRSSPVPLLLKRVQRLAKMNFYEIMEELTPDEVTKLKSSSKE
jgi:type VI secretion system protein ImpA